MEEEAEIIEEEKSQEKEIIKEPNLEEVLAEEIPGTGGIIGGNSFGNFRIRIYGQDIFM